MAIEHKDIVDAERHEPKGASSAVAGQRLIADGVGGTSWATPQPQYSQLLIGASALTQAIPAAVDAMLNTNTDYSKWAQGWFEQAAAGTDVTFSVDKIIINVTGTYRISFDFSATMTGSGGSTRRIAARLGFTDTDIGLGPSKVIDQYDLSVGEIRTGARTVVVQLTAGLEVSLWFAAESAITLTIEEAALNVERIDV